MNASRQLRQEMAALMRRLRIQARQEAGQAAAKARREARAAEVKAAA